MKIRTAAGIALSMAAAAFCARGEDKPQLFKKIQISDQFYAEGASFGDFNKDGKVDIVSGPYWYEGPDFKVKHQFFDDKATKSFDPRAYSENFLAFVRDFNGDGWPDILIVGFPGKETAWYENPKGKEGPWVKHVALDVTDNESPCFGDLLGPGKPALVCMSRGQMGYATPDASDPTKPWTWHPTSPKVASYQRFTHGIGFGDVNGDGRMDLLDKEGWYEQPASLEGDPHWKKHPAPFAPARGGAQMYVFDVNGDGLPDVITSLDAHGYGLAWYEQTKEKDADGNPKFIQHVIAGDKAEKSPYGVAFSQIHAIAIADMDGDGLPDIVTGKRWWAHAPKPDGTGGDIGVNDPAVLYVYRLVRKDGKAEFVPYLVDDSSGVGTQVTVGHVSGGKLPDIVVGNKKGTFLFVNQIDQVGKDALEKMAPKALPGAAAQAK